MDKAPASSTPKMENEKLISILAYFLVGIIWYFVDEKMHKSELAKFHVKQSLNLTIISLAYGAIVSILTPVLIFIPIIGWLALFILTTVGPILFLVLFIMGVINAVNENKKEIPLVGSFAPKYLKF